LLVGVLAFLSCARPGPCSDFVSVESLGLPLICFLPKRRHLLRSTLPCLPAGAPPRAKGFTPPPICSVSFSPPRAPPLGRLPSAPPEFSRKHRLCRGLSSVGLASARDLAPPFFRLFSPEVRRRLFYSSILCAVDLSSCRRPGAVHVPLLGFRASRRRFAVQPRRRHPISCSGFPSALRFLLAFHGARVSVLSRSAAAVFLS
jgi:hypothetical protein